MISVLAHSVAEPLLPGMSEARDGVVLGGGDGALYARFEDMVVAVTARGIGRMPNGVSVGVAPDTLARVRAGDAARVWPGGLAAGPMEVLWDPDAPPSWSPRLVDVPPDDGPAIRQRLRHPSLQQDVPAEELRALGGAVASRDPSLALRALGRASGWSHREVDAWVAKLLPPELPARTTALSASLLRLAVAGDALEPARRLLDPAEPDPRAAMLSLLGIGRSTGRSYAAAMRVVASTA